ncbi:hypothetical protein Hanom_Chr12g01092611 [Helianthus anomalus]
MMISDAIEDEDKWLAEGITRIQHNAFYMHRALIIFTFSLSISDFSHLILKFFHY